jgi:hypothetical protein
MPAAPKKRNRLTPLPRRTMNKNTNFSGSRLRERTKETQRKTGMRKRTGPKKKTMNKKQTSKKRKMKSYRQPGSSKHWMKRQATTLPSESDLKRMGSLK